VGRHGPPELEGQHVLPLSHATLSFPFRHHDTSNT
jgi:hypothetical protein